MAPAPGTGTAGLVRGTASEDRLVVVAALSFVAAALGVVTAACDDAIRGLERADVAAASWVALQLASSAPQVPRAVRYLGYGPRERPSSRSDSCSRFNRANASATRCATWCCAGAHVERTSGEFAPTMDSSAMLDEVTSARPLRNQRCVGRKIEDRAGRYVGAAAFEDAVPVRQRATSCETGQRALDSRDVLLSARPHPAAAVTAPCHR